MYNGKIIKSSCKTVEGTHRQHAYSDSWDDSYDIEFDGELTLDVCEAIIRAFKGSRLYATQSQSSWGALRWGHADGDVRINIPNRQVIVSRSMGIAD
jgi:hypothetical protein